MKLRDRAWMLGLSLTAAAWLEPATADACGGFFCNSAQPVNQAAERIIFAHQPNGHVAAVIQIQYTGPSERFSWLLPVQGTPEVAVSSNSVFTALQGATNPQYTLTTRVEGACRNDGFPNASRAGFADASAARDSAPGPGGGVTVVDAGSVGPYDYVTLEFDGAMEDEQFTVAREWLTMNGFDAPEMSRDTIEPYLDMGMNLIAFRLTKESDTGSIRPIILDFGVGDASIPIRPTALAATPDMGVMVWIAGEHRAIPANYNHLELNEALINWLSPNSNYNAVVTLAANESGGQGFVTEMAGEVDLPSLVGIDGVSEDFEATFAGDWEGREDELLSATLARYGAMDGMRDVITMHVAPPEGVTQEQFVGCPQCYIRDGRISSSAAMYIDAIRELVIKPLADTAALFEGTPYLTRLYSTMSADEMTVDPIFQFNPDLPDYSNMHTATRVIECSPSVYQFEAPWRVTLPNGDVVRGRSSNWPFTVQPDGPMPANSRILRVGTSGEGRVVTDNVDRITSALTDNNASVGGPSGSSDGGGCSIAPRSSGVALLALGLGALAAAALRRRRVTR